VSDCYPPTYSLPRSWDYRSAQLVYWDRVLLTFCLCWPWTKILLTSPISGPGAQLYVTFFKKFPLSDWKYHSCITSDSFSALNSYWLRLLPYVLCRTNS
jgi:hypothetical protein